MSTYWSQIGFEVELTEDGSPSLRQLASAVHADQKGESMHHSGGAAAETELIYGKPISLCFQTLPEPHFVCVGLGLGYIELVVAREALRAQKPCTLESWESVPELKNYFVNWLKGAPQPVEITTVYERVLDFVVSEKIADPHDLSSDSAARSGIKKVLLENLNSGGWQLQGALGADVHTERKAHGLLFDAFSAKTTPELWTEEFLMTYFQQALAEDSFLSTYASRTTLKKALKESGFEIVIRPGFKGKRNSTLAFKGVFKAIFAPAGIF